MQMTNLSQNDCLANVKIYSIPTFWQNEGIACKKYSSIPTSWGKYCINNDINIDDKVSINHKSSFICIPNRNYL